MSLYIGIFLLSSATLLFEVALSRIFSISQWYHFAFMAVGLALLGSGAGGSLLQVWQGRLRKLGGTLAPGAALFALSVVGGYLACNWLPFDSFRLGLDRIQIAYLAGYYLALTLPFLVGGFLLGLVLVRLPHLAGRIYFANLLGAGAGALASAVVLSWASCEKAVVLAALLGLGAAAAFRRIEARRAIWPEGLLAALFAGGLVLLARPWPFLAVRLSPYKALSQILRAYDARREGTWWNAAARYDVVSSSTIHSAPGLSLRYTGELPPQKALLADGDNPNPITRSSPEEADYLDSTPIALAYRLASPPRVLILQPGGGLAVLAALRYGAESVVAVEGNDLPIRLLRGPYREDSAGVYTHPRLSLVAEHPRSFLARDSSRYDLVHLALSDSYKVVTWGAYSLGENYLYTVEGLAEAFRHLDGDGFLVLERWLQLPPSEETRAWATLVSALEREGIASPGEHLAAIRSFQTVLILAKRTPLAPQELTSIREFAASLGYDLVYLPDMNAEEANRFVIVRGSPYFQAFRAILDPSQRAAFFRQHPYDLRPTSDSHPFFFHYFRPAQIPLILAAFGRAWQPFGGGGYLVLAVLLAFVLAASSFLILFPVALSGRDKGRPLRAGVRKLPAFTYFAALGLGYLFVELPLLQYFILFLGQPTYSFAVVLGALLVTSGLGSLWGERERRARLLWLLPALVLLYPPLLGRALASLLGMSLALRALATFFLIAPLGLLMGLPLPAGIRALGRLAPDLIPWAWAVNGCASVVGSILATMLAVSFGFPLVMGLAALSYLIATIAFATAPRSGVNPAPGP